MADMPVLLEISALFIIMTIGFACGLKKILNSEAIRGISELIIKVTLPSLILVSLQRPFTKELMGDALQTLLVATVFYAAMIGTALLAVKLLGTPRKQAGILAFSLSFSNCGFIGFPVVASILGNDALFLTAIHNLLFNILAFSAGILIVAKYAEREGIVRNPGNAKLPLRKIFNNNVLASVLGFLFFIASFKIPRAVALPLEMVGALTTPLAMLVTGAMLSRTRAASVLGNWRLYAVSLIRLAVLPLLTAIALRLCGITGNLYYISVIIAGMPAASNTSLIAEVYGGDTESASAIVFMTTLLSVLSIPLLALLLK